jgi:hypothetical protein
MDAALHRGEEFDAALVFFGAALLGFEDFLAERVDMASGSVGSRRQNSRSHDQKPPPYEKSVNRRFALVSSPSEIPE